MFDWDLFLIMTMIVCVTAISFVGVNAIVTKVLDYKRSKAGMAGQSNGPAVAQITDRTDLIEDRLRVLERLATDKGTLLADEIEALRDQRRERENG